MVTPNRVRLHTLLLLTFVVHPSQPVCVDVQAEKEAVVGQSKKLTCIACMKREEVKATTRVEWHYQAKEDSQAHLIFKYDGNEVNLNNSYTGRLTWNGSQDLQDLSIAIVNVTFNDSGFYECKVFREFEFKFFNPSIIIIKNFTLSVREKGGTHEVIQVPDPYVFFFEQWSVYKRMPKIDCTHSSDDVTAIYSEIMMYVLLVFLTFWLLVEMVYCYRKISKSDEQAQDTAY